MLYYREAKDGQMLEEGITEAGALASWTAAATSLQRARLADAAVLHLLLDVRLPARRRPDLGGGRPARARLPARRDRRTHDVERRGTAAPGRLEPRGCRDRPNCRAYDPAFACELAVIVDHGMRAMLERAGGRVLLPHRDERELPAAVASDGQGSGHRRAACIASRGMTSTGDAPSVRLLGSGSILREVLAAAELLAEGLACRERSLQRDELQRACAARRARRERWNRLHPERRRRRSHVARLLEGNTPIVAATDYVRALPQLIARIRRCRFTALGTDGFGRSDTRAVLRRFFEVDRHHIVVAALTQLERGGCRAERRGGARSSATASTRTAAPPWTR